MVSLELGIIVSANDALDLRLSGVPILTELNEIG